MAITSGAGPHQAWLTVNGATFPVTGGSVEQQATKKTSTFSANIPLFYPGAIDATAQLGDNVATVTVLSRGMQATLFTGEADTTEFDYVGGFLRVNGRDKSAKLHESQTAEKWLNKTGSDIVSDLAGRAGLSVNVDSSALMAGKNLQQDYVKLSDNVTYAHVIHKLAELDGARWWVDQNGTLQYRSSNSPSGTYTLNYSPPNGGPMSADFMALRIRRNIQAGKGITVNVKSWHPKEKKTFEYTANVPGLGGPVNRSKDIPGMLQDHVTQHAKSHANELARHELTVSATVAGDPSINVAMGLQINGTGYWDQTYEMDAVQHQFGMAGHTTSITARSPKSGRSAS